MHRPHYIKTTCRIRDRIEVTKHYDLRYGAPGYPREERSKPSPQEMVRQNLWKRCQYLRRLIELNFGPGDWHVVLTCRPEERPDPEEAPDVIRKFRDKLRAAFKKRGWELKYIITCETGKRGAVHWHMIVNDCHDGTESTASLIRQLWIRGRPYFSPMDESGEYGKLAEYIVKETADRIKNQETTEKLSYMPSRNLIKPVERKKKVEGRSWRRIPKAPKGWELVKGSLVNGVNKYNGLPYQYYTIRRIGKEREDEAGGRLYRDKYKRTGRGTREDPVCHEDRINKW